MRGGGLTLPYIFFIVSILISIVCYDKLYRTLQLYKDSETKSLNRILFRKKYIIRPTKDYEIWPFNCTSKKSWPNLHYNYIYNYYIKLPAKISWTYSYLPSFWLCYTQSSHKQSWFFFSLWHNLWLFLFSLFFNKYV